jgi:hypothetical protein
MIFLRPSHTGTQKKTRRLVQDGDGFFGFDKLFVTALSLITIQAH